MTFLVVPVSVLISLSIRSSYVLVAIVSTILSVRLISGFKGCVADFLPEVKLLCIQDYL